ncbi:hypothetical protein [Kalamiella sp. sgz302252]|uniref:hypothetical protein n=1 Tax=Pantoea sp. sgz302252 TaxID=3341827 RepID=UPI0036D3ADB0
MIGWPALISGFLDGTNQTLCSETAHTIYHCAAATYVAIPVRINLRIHPIPKPTALWWGVSPSILIVKER